ncbi:flavin reductase [candidate division KSB3 bacterium]|uniref:Flavin reductase n=1 Tax=candidate division KSB3 bacterium TaxID=2044937 RepID=A0A2G6E5P7_9BACT|nr:MAG: flavin reductase [candidate division KSB3 bacterium]PIE29918.1 MAG: flavin reductase [candidate division KSB3 bacterium]
MERTIIPSENFLVSAHNLWANRWLLLTSGNFETGHFNTMTVGWGSFGTMWKKPFAQVVVRPGRYTFEFMEQYESFTLCAFPASQKQALALLGNTSGRDGDKIAEASLTPSAASLVAAPAFEEAELIVECRTMYWDDLKPAHFLDASIESNYPLKDYHRVYFGEILRITGTNLYSR